MVYYRYIIFKIVQLSLVRVFIWLLAIELKVCNRNGLRLDQVSLILLIFIRELASICILVYLLFRLVGGFIIDLRNMRTGFSNNYRNSFRLFFNLFKASIFIIVILFFVVTMRTT